MRDLQPSFWTLARHGRVVRLTRTREAHPDLAAALAAFEQVLAALADLGDLRGRSGLLVDLRASPQITDPAVEGALQPFRVRVLDGFAAGAALVDTLGGRLQLHRLERIDRAYRTFDDEEEALAYLDAALDAL